MEAFGLFRRESAFAVVFHIFLYDLLDGFYAIVPVLGSAQSSDFSPQQFFEPRQSSSFVIFARDLV